MRIKITEITEWRKDSALEGGDASREGWDAVQSLELAEREAKADGGGCQRRRRRTEDGGRRLAED